VNSFYFDSSKSAGRTNIDSTKSNYLGIIDSSISAGATKQVVKYNSDPFKPQGYIDSNISAPPCSNELPKCTKPPKLDNKNDNGGFYFASSRSNGPIELDSSRISGKLIKTKIE